MEKDVKSLNVLHTYMVYMLLFHSLLEEGEEQKERMQKNLDIARAKLTQVSQTARNIYWQACTGAQSPHNYSILPLPKTSGRLVLLRVVPKKYFLYALDVLLKKNTK